MDHDPILSPDELDALDAYRRGDLDDVADEPQAPAIDPAKQAWIDAKHGDVRRGPDDQSRAGAEQAIRDAQAPPADSLLGMNALDPAENLRAAAAIYEAERAGRDDVTHRALPDPSAPPATVDDGAPLASAPDSPAPVDPPAAPAEQAPAADAGPAPSRTSALDAALAPQMGLDLGVEHTVRPTIKLSDRFVVPPFTTLDSRSNDWRTRKRAWLGLGIQSELGREGTLTYQTDTVLDPDFYRKKEEAEAAIGRRLTLDEFRRDHYRGLDAPPASIQNTGTSIFDPVLCEIAYRWFSPAGGTVLDPFAGGSVRGIVASILGRRYVGIELRPEQIAANRTEAGRLVGPETPYDFGGDTPMPTWVEGSATDARALLTTADKGRGPDDDRVALPPGGADLIFTCPPYADLEVYSDDPRDLSTAPYPTFRAMLASAMAQTAELLRRDRFAVWVVGEARDPRTGYSYGIIADTVAAAAACGLHLYNEAILMTAIASAAMRATKQVVTSRKLVRVHQHVLVFVKGDPRTAALACGDPMEVA